MTKKFPKASSLIKEHFLLIIITILILCGSTRLFYLVLHDPVFGYANNFDFIRIESRFSLWPDVKEGNKFNANFQAPINNYKVSPPFTEDFAVPSSENIFVKISIICSDIYNKFSGNESALYDIRTLGLLRAILLLTANLFLTYIFYKHSKLAGGVLALIFALITTDPVNTLYLNTLYSEFSVFFFSYVGVGLIIYRLYSNSKSLLLLIFVFLSITLLCFSKQQFSFFSFILIPIMFLIDYFFLKRKEKTVYLSLFILTLLINIGSCLYQNMKLTGQYGNSIRLANYYDTYFGAVLPYTSNPIKGAEYLNIPEECHEYIGQDWYTIDQNARKFSCDNVRVSKLKLIMLILKEPEIISRLSGKALSLSRPWIIPYLGQVEGKKFEKITSYSSFKTFSVASLIDNLHIKVYILIFVFNLSFFILIMGKLFYLSLFKSKVYKIDSLFKTEISYFLISILCLYTFFSSILGDGFAEFSKHFYIGKTCILLNLFLPLVYLIILIRSLSKGYLLKLTTGKTI